MCSIMGYCGPGADRAVFEAGFQRTVSRGPDDSRIADTGGGLLGFHRLAIMGLTPEGMQPFELDGSYAVCNGEIYGFEKLRRELEGKGYPFRSGSDCEILLPLYREYGTDMFAMLRSLRWRGRGVYRRPGPHRHSAPLLRVRQPGGDSLCQRAQKPDGPSGTRHALPPGTLL